MNSIKNLINFLTQPTIFVSLSTIAFAIFFSQYQRFKSWRVIWVVFGLLTAFFALGLSDPNCRQIIVKPDNIPIVIMFYLVLFFTWFPIHKAAINDARIAEGQPPVEKEESDKKVFSWPDLVFSELICGILIMAFLIFWGVTFEAPLEQFASSTNVPNPAKAPWYFLGLQEMLVYFDPWLAGVFLPTLIVVGLIAIPYIDINPKGNGYYSFAERKFAITMFQFGFLILWFLLMVLGTFLRGPNWNFFGPFEYWDTHKLEALVNVNLSELVWMRLLGQALPENILVREMPGFLAVGFYLTAVPLLLTRGIRFFREISEKMGTARYAVMIMLLLMMASMPIKMVMRWTMNMKYIVAIPEFFFNI